MTTVTTLSRLLRSGKMSASELTEIYIKAVEKVNPAINAYVYTCFDEARRGARLADKLLREGKGGALTGIPFALKDNIATEGIPTTCCSKMLKGHIPLYDAFAYSKLREQGAVLIGKTNMDEFAMGGTNENSVYGAALNPRDRTRVAGGSSGGSAAAVCADIAAFSLGSDTGGSVRRPAAFCGVVGFKPTYGAISRNGLFAYASSLDQIGSLSATVGDAATVFGAIRGKDAADMTSCAPTGEIDLKGEVKGLKIGICDEFFVGADQKLVDRISEILREYERAGAQIVRVSMPSLRYALAAYYVIACAEASSNLGRYDGVRFGYRAENCTDAAELMIKSRTEGFGKEVRKRIVFGTYVLSAGYYDACYKKACLLRQRTEADFERCFCECDVLFSPAAPTSALPLGFVCGDPLRGYRDDFCTVPQNLAGLPAISLPCGEDGNGLPYGLQITGRKFEDARVLNIAYFAEKVGLCKAKNIGGGVGL